MKERLKMVMYERFVELLENNETINLDRTTLRKVCNQLASASTDIHDENSKILEDLHSQLVLDYERNRSQFIGMIKVIEKYSKFIIDDYKKKSLIKLEHSQLARKTQMKANSSVLSDVVNYFNLMNDLVIKFYSDVYQIEKMDSKQTDIKQTSLF
jgi:hypothetical protein